jgi:hypothetical protein
VLAMSVLERMLPLILSSSCCSWAVCTDKILQKLTYSNFRFVSPIDLVSFII